jgi:hypothetical protein
MKISESMEGINIHIYIYLFINTGRFRKSFTISKAHVHLLRGCVQYLKYNVAKQTEFYLG